MIGKHTKRMQINNTKELFIRRIAMNEHIDKDLVIKKLHRTNLFLSCNYIIPKIFKNVKLSFPARMRLLFGSSFQIWGL